MRARDQLEDDLFTSWFQCHDDACGGFQTIGKSFRHSHDVATTHVPLAEAAATRRILNAPGMRIVHELLVENETYQSYSCTVADYSSRVEVRIFNEGAFFRSELSVLIGVEHPHLVKIMNLIVGPPQTVISSLCEFGTVATLLHHPANSSRLTNLSICARLRALMQVISALEYVHELNIIHRNVAPENCFLSRPLAEVPAQILDVPTLQLGNFDHARIVDREMSTFVGTVRYMSPEVMQSESYGLPADVFSCGILLYEIITGHIPYSNSEREHMLALQVLRGLRPDTARFPSHREGADICSIAENSWKADPIERPSLAKLRASLQKLIGDTDSHT
jgi:serine/threonine protein kinase